MSHLSKAVLTVVRFNADFYLVQFLKSKGNERKEQLSKKRQLSKNKQKSA